MKSTPSTGATVIDDRIWAKVHRKPKDFQVLEQIFNDIGYAGKEAHIRARVMYYHRVGYYAMGVQESQKERRGLIPALSEGFDGTGLLRAANPSVSAA